MKSLHRALPIAIAAGLAAASALTVGAVPAFANSAPAYWFGSAASGSAVLEKNCPVEVQREDLTLTVPTLPKVSWSGEEFAKYAAHAEAKYTFYNPTDADLDVTLAFPFGERPDYIPETGDDTARYTVTADGGEVEREVRYILGTFSETASAYVAAEGKVEDDFYTPDLVCHTHVVDATLKNTGEEQGYLSVMLSYSPQRTRILFGHAAYTWGIRDGEFQILYRMDGGLTATFYSFGEEPQITAAVYSADAAFEDVRKPLTTAEISEGETTTLAAFLEAQRPASVEENNYYNLIVADYFQSRGESGALPVLPLTFREEDLSRVYVYSLHIPARETVENTVTAPLYPTIREGRYSYEYLLSPAQGWARFGSFNLKIVTDFGIENCTLPLTKTQDGYEYSREGLPLGELCFDINAEHGGGLSLPASSAAVFLVVIGCVFFAAQVIAGIVVIAVVCRKKK